MNKLWVFGCSFTDYGFAVNFPLWLESDHEGVKKTYPYILTRQERDAHWVRVLQRELSAERGIDYHIEQWGQGGLSREGVLRKVLFFLDEYQSGDVVVLGVTTFGRMSFLTEYTKENRDMYLTSMWWKDAEGVLELGDYPLSDWADNPLGERAVISTKDARQSIAAYFLSTVDPKSGNDDLHINADRFNEDALYSIARLLRCKGVEVYLWDYTLWTSDVNGVELSDNSNTFVGLQYDKHADQYFENIEQWVVRFHTGDGHWSPNGNLKAGRFFNWCIQNGHLVFDKKLLKEFDSQYREEDYIEFEVERILNQVGN